VKKCFPLIFCTCRMSCHVCTAVARPAYIRGMADLDAALRSLMRDLGGALRPAGFRGSGGTWRLATPEGVAIVSRQGSDWGPGGKRFYVNTAVVPAAWWAWLNRTRADAPPITSAREYHGIRLLEGRVEATGPASFESGDKTLWSVRLDTDLDRLRDDLVTGGHRGGDLAGAPGPARPLPRRTGGRTGQEDRPLGAVRRAAGRRAGTVTGAGRGVCGVACRVRRTARNVRARGADHRLGSRSLTLASGPRCYARAPGPMRERCRSDEDLLGLVRETAGLLADLADPFDLQPGAGRCRKEPAIRRPARRSEAGWRWRP
jgi:hypothetical protein